MLGMPVRSTSVPQGAMPSATGAPLEAEASGESARKDQLYALLGGGGRTPALVFYPRTGMPRTRPLGICDEAQPLVQMTPSA
jgi:hypothetical protein